MTFKNFPDAAGKFSGAVSVLATSLEPLKGRIYAAYRGHLSRIRVADLPDDLAADFDRLMTRLTSQSPVANEGQVRATLDSMSDGEAQILAKEIMALAHDFERESFRHRYQDQ